MVALILLAIVLNTMLNTMLNTLGNSITLSVVSTEYVILCTVCLCLMLYRVQNKASWSPFKVTSQLDFSLYVIDHIITVK